MARPLRIENSGAVYHVTSRGDGRLKIFTAGGDKGLFLQVLENTVNRFHRLCCFVMLDDLVKSSAHRHPGESRDPERLEITGFRLSPE